MRLKEDFLKNTFTNCPFSYLSVAEIDFKKLKYDAVTLERESGFTSRQINFDLASLTKPFTLSPLYFSEESELSKNEVLLLEHRAGLPDWGYLSSKTWRDEILSYSIKESKVLYSDYSALRLMLEWEAKSEKKLQDFSKKYWDKGIFFWRDLPEDAETAPTGFRGGRVLQGKVHDPNAYSINEFCSHAGLFGDINAVAKTIIKMEKEFSLISAMDREFAANKKERRFLKGFDTAQGPDSLAGQGCSKKTFGHLSFTGCSFWIDIEKQFGLVLLSNATEKYWFARDELNSLRRNLGEKFWSGP